MTSQKLFTVELYVQDPSYSYEENDLHRMNFQNESFLHPQIFITTPNGKILTATDLLQCGEDSSHRLHYVGFQEMRKAEWNTFLDSYHVHTCEESPKQNFHCFPEFLKLCGFILAIINNYFNSDLILIVN